MFSTPTALKGLIAYKWAIKPYKLVQDHHQAMWDKYMDQIQHLTSSILVFLPQESWLLALGHHNPPPLKGHTSPCGTCTTLPAGFLL